MYDMETGNREWIEYEKYQELERELEKSQHLINDHKELLDDLINSVKDDVNKLSEVLESTKKDLTKLKAD